MEKKESLQSIWNIRLKLKAEGDKLWTEGDKLDAEGDKLWAEGVLAVYGNIKMKWEFNGEKYTCELETGEVFK
jgi:hypothetical protein